MNFFASRAKASAKVAAITPTLNPAITRTNRSPTGASIRVAGRSRWRAAAAGRPCLITLCHSGPCLSQVKAWTA